MPTYSRTAVLCPAPQVYSALVLPGGGAPTTREALVGGESTALLTKWNTNAAAIDALGQIGAGAYAVRQGTGELTAGAGLTLNVSALAILVDGPVAVAAQTLALTDGADNHIWALRTGVVAKQTGSLLPPTGGLVYLGTVTTAAGAITAIDYSGRLEFRGSGLYRRTADAGAPGDTPPASLLFVNRTAGGRYMWDGDAYFLLG